MFRVFSSMNEVAHQLLRHSNDGFGRLRDGWHYLYGNPVNEWSERNITYDRNGNVLSLLRYGSSGTTPLNNYTISYEGNRASMLNNEDYFEYDFNGNVTGDAARGMAIGYNLLNLPSWFIFFLIESHF